MGVTKEQAQHLFVRYPLERIQRQMEWLPFRNAKNPLGYLLAAIEGDYERPLSLRQNASQSPTVDHSDGSSSSTAVSSLAKPMPIPFYTAEGEEIVNSS